MSAANPQTQPQTARSQTSDRRDPQARKSLRESRHDRLAGSSPLTRKEWSSAHHMAARAPLIMSRAASSVGPLPAAATTVARHQSAQCLRARGAVDGLFFDQRTARPVHHLLPGAKFEAIGRYPNTLCRFDTVSSAV
jgi:hypothetical protein